MTGKLTPQEATDALYNGGRVTLRAGALGLMFSIRRHKNGHTIPAIWVYNEDGTLNNTVNWGHNGLLFDRQRVEEWIGACDIVSVE